MTRIIIKKLIWDDFNIDHIKKHEVTREEIEKAVKQVVYHKHTYGKRYLVVCEEEERIITIVIVRKSLSTYYVVSARTAKKSERKNK